MSKQQQNSLLPQREQVSPEAVDCLGQHFPSDEARRSHFCAELRAKLQDPDFRKTEGFPVAGDDDIVALSDPPYYTACPNPFLQAVLTDHDQRSVKDTDLIHREPYSFDVAKGKESPVYTAHSYHTKVPHEAIESYIAHYTQPGNIVLDAFSGTGMTGLACQALGRVAILCDLAPAATFISQYYNHFPDVDELADAIDALVERVEQDCGWMYEVKSKNQTGTLNYAIHSEVFFCGECSGEVVYWDLEETSECPHCRAEVGKKDLQRKIDVDGKTELRPVLLNFNFGKKRHTREPNKDDLELLQRIDSVQSTDWFPTDRMMHRKSPWGGYHRAGYHQGYEQVSDFYTRRNLLTLARMWAIIEEQRLPTFLRFVVTSFLAMRCSLRMPFRAGGRSAGAINNLHIPSLIQEYNPIGVLHRKGKAFVRAAASAPRGGQVFITTQSATDLSNVPSDSVDYVFVDPPFGDNILYAELNFFWEAWLKVFTNEEDEAIVSQYQGKGFNEYEGLMTSSFASISRVLKPGRWMTVEFHNSRNSIWNAIQEALTSAGFVVADVRMLDKKQGSYKQVSTAGAVKKDLIISAYKPSTETEKRFELAAGSEEGVWEFVRSHLNQLPVFVAKADRAETVAERHNYMLFDRMVAFHVQRGVTIPVSAGSFYGGLHERFPERDGMYFLPEQAAQYDKQRMKVKELIQLELFVSDEASARRWLKQELGNKPQSFQDIQPQFMREVGGWEKHEKPLELSEMLQQSFLYYDGEGEVPSQIHGYLSSNFHELRNLDKDDPRLIAKAKNRWYVADPRKEADLEKIRHRALMREFEVYRESKGRLKVVRTEALRAGFKECWQNSDYHTIVTMAKRVKDEIIQEDPALLMYYDNAMMRTGG